MQPMMLIRIIETILGMHLANDPLLCTIASNHTREMGLEYVK
jgi:hypothetical protein